MKLVAKTFVVKIYIYFFCHIAYIALVSQNLLIYFFLHLVGWPFIYIYFHCDLIIPLMHKSEINAWLNFLLIVDYDKFTGSFFLFCQLSPPPQQLTKQTPLFCPEMPPIICLWLLLTTKFFADCLNVIPQCIYIFCICNFSFVLK